MKVKAENKYKEQNEKGYLLVIYNNDIHSFAEVIDLLINICNLDILIAEKFMLIAHHNGKCGVKEGSIEELIPMKEKLEANKLDASIVST